MKQLALGFDRLSRKHLYYAACVGVLVAAAVLRFHNLSETSLWLDEAIAANNSRGTFWEVALYTRHRNSSPVLYPYLLWAVQLVESSPFSVRFVPALASTLTVGVFLFVLPNVGVGRTASLIAGLLAGLSPAAIEEARGVREYGVDALVALLLIVGVLIYLRGQKEETPSVRDPHCGTDTPVWPCVVRSCRNCDRHDWSAVDRSPTRRPNRLLRPTAYCFEANGRSALALCFPRCRMCDSACNLVGSVERERVVCTKRRNIRLLPR